MTDMRNNLFNVETLSLIMSKKDRHNGESNGKPKELYIELAKIIGLFPDETPSGILNSICDVPHFSGSYESVLSILSIKINDGNEKIGLATNAQCKQDIKTEISNWEYVSKRLKKNRKDFEDANTLYEKYIKDYAGEMKILFSREVLNRIVVFDTYLNNAFGMPGLYVERDTVQDIKEKVIDAMRQDVGTF